MSITMPSIDRRFVFVLFGCAAALAIACGRPTPESQTKAGQAPPDGRPSASASDAANQAQSHESAAGAPKSAPAFREIVVPAGTALTLRLTSALASDSSKVEDAVRATLDAPVSVHGDVVLPDGAALEGSVLSVQRSGKVKGRAALSFGFDRLSVRDDHYDVHTARISRLARATKGKDAQKIGIGAGAGALIGGLAGGGKGALIGSAVGAGAGTGVVMATRGEEVRLAPGTKITTKLLDAVTVRVPVS